MVVSVYHEEYGNNCEVSLGYVNSQSHYEAHGNTIYYNYSYNYYVEMI